VSDALTDPKDRRILAWILAALFALGAAARLYILCRYGNGMTLMSDDNAYRLSAKLMLETGTFIYNYVGKTVFTMPAYPAFLASLFGIFGYESGQIAARVVQCGVSLAGAWFVWLIARRLVRDPYSALLPVALVLFYPAAIMTSNLLLTETWATTLLVAAAYVSIRFVESPTWIWAATLGLSAAAVAYFRPTYALFPVGVCAIMFFKWLGTRFWRRVGAIALAAAVMALCMSPWWIRNAVVFHEFIPFTEGTGNPLLYATYVDWNGIVNGDRPDWPDENDGRVADSLFKQMGIERFKAMWAADPAGTAHWYLIGKYEYFWRFPFDWYPIAEFSALFAYGWHYAILILGFLGFLVWLFRRKKGDHGVLLWILAWGTLVYIPFATSARYAYPLTWLIAAFAALVPDLLNGVLEKIRDRTYNKAIATEP
jgi:4-amino-4-deoxy-L-arabinose transferase-like glycosyltransferase